MKIAQLANSVGKNKKTDEIEELKRMGSSLDS
jgi:hypothetical protein